MLLSTLSSFLAVAVKAAFTGFPVQRDDTIEICINPDGHVWGEFQGDHFMRGLGTPLTQTEIKDLGNQIASAASTTLSTKKPIVSVSILYRDRPIRAQVTPRAAAGTIRGSSLAGVALRLRRSGNPQTLFELNPHRRG